MFANGSQPTGYWVNRALWIFVI